MLNFKSPGKVVCKFASFLANAKLYRVTHAVLKPVPFCVQALQQILNCGVETSKHVPHLPLTRQAAQALQEKALAETEAVMQKYAHAEAEYRSSPQPEPPRVGSTEDRSITPTIIVQNQASVRLSERAIVVAQVRNSRGNPGVVQELNTLEGWSSVATL